MGEYGQVLKVNGDEATIKLQRKQACERCKACIAGMNKNEMVLIAKNDCNAKPDDWVNIELSEQYFLKATGIMYGLPLIMMMAGFAVGYFIVSISAINVLEEIIIFFSGLIFLLASYYIIKLKNGVLDVKKYRPSATAVVSKPTS